MEGYIQTAPTKSVKIFRDYNSSVNLCTGEMDELIEYQPGTSCKFAFVWHYMCDKYVVLTIPVLQSVIFLLHNLCHVHISINNYVVVEYMYTGIPLDIVTLI